MGSRSRQIYFDLQNFKYKKCLEPTGTCKEPAIRAHSIQNKVILESLCDKGHVIMPQITHHSNGKPEAIFNRVGRNQASTFAGLCSQHDAHIFEPIEQILLDLHNPEHLFLLSYRSVLKEAHSIFQSACKVQSAFFKKMELKSTSGTMPDSAEIIATEWLCNAYDMHCYKLKFDEAYLAKAYNTVEHILIKLDNTLPSFAASSLFSLDDIDWPDDVARIALNAFPYNGGTIALFSYLVEEKSYAQQYIQQILNASGFYQKYLISKLILQHTENFVLSPIFHNQMPADQRQAIRNFFCATLYENQHDDKPSI